MYEELEFNFFPFSLLWVWENLLQFSAIKFWTQKKKQKEWEWLWRAREKERGRSKVEEFNSEEEIYDFKL